MTKEIQLKLNAEYLAGLEANFVADNEGVTNRYPATREEIIKRFYNDLFNIKVLGHLVVGEMVGGDIVGSGICDNLKILGKETCENALVEAFANEGLLMLIE